MTPTDQEVEAVVIARKALEQIATIPRSAYHAARIARAAIAALDQVRGK